MRKRRKRRAIAANEKQRVAVAKSTITTPALEDGGKLAPASMPGGGLLDDEKKKRPPLRVVSNPTTKTYPDEGVNVANLEEVAKIFDGQLATLRKSRRFEIADRSVLLLHKQKAHGVLTLGGVKVEGDGSYSWEIKDATLFDRPKDTNVEKGVTHAGNVSILEKQKATVAHDPISKIRDVKTYDPSKVSDAVLRDDFRIVLAWHAGKTKHSEAILEGLLRKILREAVKRGPKVIRFDPKGMAPSVRPFFERVARSVKVPAAMFKGIAFAPDSDPSDMTTAELLKAHDILHGMYRIEALTQLGVKGWSLEDVVNFHALIVDELEDRDKKHPPPPSDELDSVSQEFEASEVKKAELAPVNHGGEGKQGKRIKPEDVLPFFKTFKLRAPYIYLTGGIVNDPKGTTGDIDVLIKDSEKLPKEFRHVLEFRLGRALPPELAERLSIHFDKYHGPITNHIPLFDLAAERLAKVEVKEMSDAGGAEVEIEKARLALWGSTAGKTRIASKIVAKIPDHSTYVEPFAGGAAVFYAKPKSKVEVLADANPEVAHAFRFIRDLTAEQIKAVKAKDWKVTREQAKRVHELSPKSGVDRFYRFAFKRYALFMCNENRITAIDPSKEGKVASIPDRLEATRDRLKGVKVEDSFAAAVKKYDSAETFYYLDPPYADLKQEVGEKSFDEAAFIKTLQGLKGKFLLHYDGNAAAKFKGKGWNVRTIKVNATPGHTVGGVKVGKLVEVDNYTKPVKKQEPRAASPSFLRDANRARKADKLTLGEFFFMPKPTRPAEPEEPQTIEGLLELYEDHPDRFPVRVQKKYDGARHQIHRDGAKVAVISEDGTDNTNRLPGIVKAILALKPKKLVLDCEIERWTGRQHLPREAVAGYLASKDEADDSDAIANVFDVLYTEADGDIHKWPTGQRLRKLSALGIKQSTVAIPDLGSRLNAAPGIEAEDLEALEKAVRVVRELPGSEGIVSKQTDAPYPLDVETPDTWVKFHNSAAIRGLVTGKTKTAGGAWVYQWAIRPGKAEPAKTVDAKGAKVVPVGDTFASSRDFEIGDRILIEVETLNVIRGPKGVEVTAWVPRVLGDYAGKADTTDSAAARARRGLVLQVKEIDAEGKTRFLPTRKVTKEADPFMEVPDESKSYRYTVQHHWRGKGLHSDLRIGFRPGKLLLGWTLNTQIAGVVKDPVTTLAEAKAWGPRFDEISKIDWRSGEWAERSKRGASNPVRVEILSERKAPEPWAWMDVEGKTKDPEPGKAPPVGGMRKFPGVFHIVDQGAIEFGAQKPWLHEYFVHGGAMSYRIFFRQLKLGAITKARHSYSTCMECKTAAPTIDVLWADGRGRAWFCKACYPKWLKKVGGKTAAEVIGTKAILGGNAPPKYSDVHKRAEEGIEAELHPLVEKAVLPPSEAAVERPLGGQQWLAIQPDDVTPYVISPDAAKKKWMPPLGVSALPKAVRSQIPEAFRFWTKRSVAEARTTRDELVEAICKGEVKINSGAPYKVQKATQLDAAFVLQEQSWKGQTQVRAGPSKRLWYLRIDIGRPKVIVLQFHANPLDGGELAAVVDEGRKASMAVEGPIKPGHYLNPTKNTPSVIEVLDKGKAKVLSLSKDFIKVEIEGRKFKGLFGVTRNNGEWLMAPTKAAPETDDGAKVAKRAQELADASWFVPIQKVDKEKRLVTGVVLEPGEVDAQNDTISAEVIEKASIRFLARFNDKTQLGLMHKQFGDVGLELAHSWIALEPSKVGGKKVKKGSWLMTMRVVSDKLWQRVKKGEFAGFSVGGVATVAG